MMREHDLGLTEMGQEVTETELRNDTLAILQPRCGYRFSVDSLILADFVRLRPRDRVLDLGAGCGVISLILGRRNPRISVTAVEVQGGLAALARRNVLRNRLDRRIRVFEADLNTVDRFIPAGSCDHVVCNPPYRRPSSGRLCKDVGQAAARHEILTDLSAILRGSRYVLRPGGRISLVYPAGLSARLIGELRTFSLEPKRLRMVHSRPQSAARLILIEGCKDAGEEMTVAPPLFLNHEDGLGHGPLTRPDLPCCSRTAASTSGRDPSTPA